MDRSDRDEREWKRLTTAYDLFLSHQLSRYRTDRSLSARIYRRINRLQLQFLSHYFAKVPAWRVFLRSVGGKRTLPDFICTGALKSGTSDLAVYLLQHPSIIPPLCKEIREIDPAAWYPYFPTVREKRRVAQKHGIALSGNFTPFMHFTGYVDSVAAVKPDARIILNLRDPVERACSHYKWDLFLGGKPLIRNPYYTSFARYVDTALDLFPASNLFSSSGFPFLQSGIYSRSVQLWIDRFGRENVMVVRTEDFFQDPVTVVGDIQEFLGLPRILPLRREVVLKNPIPSPPYEEHALQQLSEFYRPWNEKLYELLGRDMGWR